MRVLLDTNVLLMSVPSKSPYHGIVKAFNKKLFELVITTSIFLEYEEIISVKSNVIIARNILAGLAEAGNVVVVEVFYEWNLIITDPDDNKFTDAYVCANADWLITNDSHFNEAKKSTFPKINILTPDEFLRIIEPLM